MRVGEHRPTARKAKTGGLQAVRLDSMRAGCFPGVVRVFRPSDAASTLKDCGGRIPGAAPPRSGLRFFASSG